MTASQYYNSIFLSQMQISPFSVNMSKYFFIKPILRITAFVLLRKCWPMAFNNIQDIAQASVAPREHRIERLDNLNGIKQYLSFDSADLLLIHLLLLTGDSMISCNKSCRVPSISSVHIMVSSYFILGKYSVLFELFNTLSKKPFPADKDFMLFPRRKSLVEIRKKVYTWSILLPSLHVMKFYSLAIEVIWDKLFIFRGKWHPGSWRIVRAKYCDEEMCLCVHFIAMSSNYNRYNKYNDTILRMLIIIWE